MPMYFRVSLKPIAGITYQTKQTSLNCSDYCSDIIPTHTYRAVILPDHTGERADEQTYHNHCRYQNQDFYFNAFL